MALVRKLTDLKSESYTLLTSDGPIVVTIRHSDKRVTIQAPVTVKIERERKAA